MKNDYSTKEYEYAIYWLTEMRNNCERTDQKYHDPHCIDKRNAIQIALDVLNPICKACNFYNG